MQNQNNSSGIHIGNPNKGVPNNQNLNSPVLGISQKEFNGTVFVLNKPNVIHARTLQLKIGKILGAPFIKFFGDGSEDAEEDVILDGLSEALHAIEPEQSVMLIKELCELTINQKMQSPTVYERDFDAASTQDIEVAMWVVQEIFGNFLTALSKSGLGAQAMGMLSPSQE